MKFKVLVQDGENASNMPKKPKLKVAFLLPCLNAGGAERVLITLMNRLDRTRFEPVFITVSEEGTMRDWIDPEIPFHSLGKTRKVTQGLWPLFRKLRQIKPDVVFSTMAHMNYVTLLLRPFFPKTRFIVREAIVPSFICETVNKGWLARLAYQVLYPWADLVISPSQRIINEFEDYLGMAVNNHALLYNPVDVEKIRNMPEILPNPGGERAKTVHYVCAGRLHHQKGFDRLIESLQWLNHDYPWKLTILGEGEERGNLEALIKKYDLEDRVHMPGLAKKPWPMIGAADCFLMPSRWEGLPNAVLESLSVGTPAIATSESGGIAEIAQMSPNGAVTVVDTMPDFIEAMRMVTPAPNRLYRPSLLPLTFRLETVMKRFSNMLEGKEIEDLPLENFEPDQAEYRYDKASSSSSKNV